MLKDIRLFAKECALKRLDRRERSSEDVYCHLIQKEIPPEIVSDVISDLTKLNLINDERFAKLFTREQASRGHGPYRIRQKLKEKGIDLNLNQIKDLLEEVTQTTELETAKNLVSRRYPHAWQSKTETARALQALLRRGFSFPIAREALARPKSE